MSGGGGGSSSDSTQSQNSTSSSATHGTGLATTTPVNAQQLLEGLNFSRGAYMGDNPGINNALGNINSYGNQGAATAGQGANYLGNVMGGQYLNSNPYLDETYNRAADQMQGQMRSAWGGSDVRPGSSGMQQAAFANGLAGLGNSIYGGNYQAERDRMQQAAGMVPGTVGAMTQPGQVQLQANYAPLTNYLQALSSISPGSSISSSKDITSSGTASGNATASSGGANGSGNLSFK